MSVLRDAMGQMPLPSGIWGHTLREQGRGLRKERQDRTVLTRHVKSEFAHMLTTY